MTYNFNPTVFKKWRPSKSSEFNKFYAADIVNNTALTVCTVGTSSYDPSIPLIDGTCVEVVVQSNKESFALSSLNEDSTELEFYQAMQQAAIKLLEISTNRLHKCMIDGC
jgi:hypothetical protein